MAINASEDVDNLINGGYLLLFLVVGGVAVYIIYEVVEGASSAGNAIANLGCSIFGGTNCDTSSDPNSLGLESYSSAAVQTVEHPIQTVETILGLNQGDSGDGVDTTTMSDADMSGMGA